METITYTFKEGDAVKIEGLNFKQKEDVFNKMLKDGCPEWEEMGDYDYPYLYWKTEGTCFYYKLGVYIRGSDEPWNYLTWEDITKSVEVEKEEFTPIEEYTSEPLSDDLQEELPETLYSFGGLIKMSQDLSETTLGSLNITLQGDGQLLLHGNGFPCIVLTDLNPTEINKVLEVMKMLDGKFVEDVQ